MYIVGTSGHIDHGKTSLINALTGIDCDRLPEEKERAMTIDIGFASIEYPRFGTVSIIDVPGHERFIRNMVAGAWGIDLALLVVAVDDGWMPQTEDHFRVLQFLGVERIIPVLNKIDIADEEMIEFVEEEVKEKLENTRYRDPEIVKVSSITGDGIADLKEKIVENLRKLSKAQNSKKPYLFVDRVFDSKGHGTIVTGTLKNGVFKEEDVVTILPIEKESRIRRIESHYNEDADKSPSQRTALNLANISKEDLYRGSIIFKENFFTSSNDIIAKIELLNTKKEIKNNLGIEILIGTSTVGAKLILLDESDKGKQIFIARIKFNEKWYSYPGQPFIVTSPGGYRIVGGGVVLLPDYNSKAHKQKVKNEISLFNEYSKLEIIEFLFKIKLHLNWKEIFALLPDNEKTITKQVNQLIEEGKFIEHKEHIFIADYFDRSQKAMVDVIENNIGLNLKEIGSRAKLTETVTKLIIDLVIKENTIVEKDGRYFGGNSITEEQLPDKKKKLLKDLLSNGKTGIEINKISNDFDKKDLKDLIKLDFAISLDGNIIFHKDVYDDCKNKIMSLFKDHDKITVPEAKDSVDLSRKYIIPLLNRIESDSLIKRLGDFRIKV